MKYMECANSLSQGEQPETIVTDIDVSGSMELKMGDTTRLKAAIRASEALLDVKADRYPQDRMAVVEFSHVARLLHPPAVVGRDREALRAAIHQARSSGSTNVTAALQIAGEVLLGWAAIGTENFLTRMLGQFLCETKPVLRPSRPALTGSKRVILLTDGAHNDPSSPLPVAGQLKKAGVVIDCIGIGDSPHEVDEALLKQIASRNPDGSIRYCFIRDQASLIRKYQSLAHHIRVV